MEVLTLSIEEDLDVTAATFACIRVTARCPLGVTSICALEFHGRRAVPVGWLRSPREQLRWRHEQPGAAPRQPVAASRGPRPWLEHDCGDSHSSPCGQGRHLGTVAVQRPAAVS